MRKDEKPELIFIPAPAVGHLVSAGELAIRLLKSDRFSHITLLLIKPLDPAAQIDAYESSLTSHSPRVTCLDLPPVAPPPLELMSKSIENFFTLYIEAQAPHVKHIVKELLGSGRRVAGVVLDFFCSSFADVATELGMPNYVYLTSGAALLSLMMYLPTRHISTEFALSDPEITMPGFANSVSPQVLPSAVLLNSEGGFAAYLKMAKRFREAKGIIVNTFLELETYALSTLSADKSIPLIYPVGPLLDLKGEGQNTIGAGLSAVSLKGIKALNWLDEQPSKSVVFLCFGSAGEFPAHQLKEIANGLERSGHRFLWSIREPEGCVDVGEILPKGFLERTGGRGVVCAWVPQVEVLAHKAIGGFVSHCGWNSILESLWNGVPIVTWPIYAEQQVNAFMMVKELDLAVELRVNYRKELGDEVVVAEEVEKAVREVMKEGSKVRRRVAEMKEKSRAALGEGGLSSDMIRQLIEDMLSADIV